MDQGNSTVGAGRTKAYDLHLHTNHSLDAFTSVDRLLAVARQKQIGIAVTDHTEIRGSVEALEKAKDVEVIPAIEVKARSGVDIMVYFEDADEMVEYYQKVLEPRLGGIHRFIPDISEREIIDGTGRYRCLLSAPHPYAPSRMGLAGVVDSGAVRHDLLERMDLVETENAMMSPRVNRKAKELAAQLKKSCIGGSDAHVPWLVGSGLTLVPQEMTLFQALRSGQTQAVGGNLSHLLSPLIFVSGQLKFLTLPNGWSLLKHNLHVFGDHARRDGSIPETA